MRWKAPRRSSFQHSRDAVTARSGPIVVSWQAGPEVTSVELAFSLNRAVGNAVVRNRLRRRLREVVRLHLDLPPGTYVVRARPQAVELSFTELVQHLSRVAASLAQRAGC